MQPDKEERQAHSAKAHKLRRARTSTRPGCSAQACPGGAQRPGGDRKHRRVLSIAHGTREGRSVEADVPWAGEKAQVSARTDYTLERHE